MMDALAPIALAFLFGFLHALDADHLAAVSSFIGQNPSPRRAVGFGLRWALGHAAALGALTMVTVILKIQISHSASRDLEFFVGAAMLALGGWVLVGLKRRKIHTHVHEHDGFRHLHFHSHARGGDHRHEHAATLMGSLHGCAGTAAFLVLVPITGTNSDWFTLLYVVAFSIGVTVAMGIYVFCVGKFFERARQRSTRMYQWGQAATGISSCAIGVWWLCSGSR